MAQPLLRPYQESQPRHVSELARCRWNTRISRRVQVFDRPLLESQLISRVKYLSTVDSAACWNEGAKRYLPFWRPTPLEIALCPDCPNLSPSTTITRPRAKQLSLSTAETSTLAATTAKPSVVQMLVFDGIRLCPAETVEAPTESESRKEFQATGTMFVATPEQSAVHATRPSPSHAGLQAALCLQ